MKTIIIFLILALTACGSSEDSSEKKAEKSVYIISGQSNAIRCSWDKFEKETGSEVISIARKGTHIDLHIDLYDYPKLKGINALGVIFVNGAADGKIETYPPYYIERMNHYRSLIHKDVGKELPFYISNIGYNTEYPDEPFDALRKEINKQKDWIVAYNGAQYFRDKGMLVDASHYSEEGCELMIDAILSRLDLKP